VSTELVAGRYQLSALLGRSALGTTHRATDIRSGTTCVVKRFPLDDPAERVRLASQVENERGRLLALSHPHLAGVLNCQVVADGQGVELLVVQQFIDGKNLDQLHGAGKRLRLLEVLEVALGAARALQVIHDDGLIHGEVRPSNLVRTPLGKVFLVDLGGLAHRLPATPAAARGWDPPEGNARLGPASDIYALGATLVFLLSGRDPATLKGADGRIEHRQAVKVPAGVAALLDTMLALEPDKRFPRGRALALALARLAPEITRQRRLRMMAGVAGGVLVAVGAAAIVRPHPGKSPAVAPERPIAARPAAAPPRQVPAAPAPAAPGVEATTGAATVAGLQAALAAGSMRDATRLTIPPAAVWASAAATDAWRALLAADLSGVEELRIEARLTRAALTELLASTTLGSLRALTFVHTGLGDDGVAAVAGSRLAGQLDTLELLQEELGEPAASALARSTRLARIRQLHLASNHLGDDGAADLARSRSLRALEMLDLTGNGLGPGALETLVPALDTGGLPALRQLTLVDNDLGPKAAAALGRASRPFEFLLQAGDPQRTAVAAVNPPPPAAPEPAATEATAEAAAPPGAPAPAPPR
jgi:hypothetical protein